MKQYIVVWSNSYLQLREQYPKAFAIQRKGLGYQGVVQV